MIDWQAAFAYCPKCEGNAYVGECDQAHLHVWCLSARCGYDYQIEDTGENRQRAVPYPDS